MVSILLFSVRRVLKTRPQSHRQPTEDQPNDPHHTALHHLPLFRIHTVWDDIQAIMPRKLVRSAYNDCHKPG